MSLTPFTRGIATLGDLTLLANPSMFKESHKLLSFRGDSGSNEHGIKPVEESWFSYKLPSGEPTYALACVSYDT